MTRHVALLRGINVGTRRMAMAELRALLESAGYDDVATYLQSGNVAVSSRASAATVAAHLRQLIEDRWGFDVPVVMRSREQLRAVLDADPLGPIAENPSRYSVLFLDEAPRSGAFDELDRAAFEPERLELRGRELYVWSPGGIARSPLMRELGRARYVEGIGSATMRNWRTVQALADL